MALSAQLGIIGSTPNSPPLLAAHGPPPARHRTSPWIRPSNLQLKRSGCFPKQAREKVRLKVQSEAPSQRTPGASPKTSGDDAVKTVSGSTSAATLTSLDVPRPVHETSPASTVTSSEASSVSTSDETGWHFSVETETVLSITVVGATGELANSKIFPALFALYFKGSLPKNFVIFGYSRSQLSDEDLRLAISERLLCRIDDHENCGEQQELFLEKVFYQAGGYESCDCLTTLDNRMKQLEGDKVANRIFYLSIPQDVVLVVASCLSESAQSESGWTRVIVEKPFGNDAESSAELTKALLAGFEEGQIYRIDHLMGKDLIENLTVLRFSNLVFEPLWTRTYIRSVQFIHSEDFGVTEGRERCNFLKPWSLRLDCMIGLLPGRLCGPSPSPTLRACFHVASSKDKNSPAVSFALRNIKCREGSGVQLPCQLSPRVRQRPTGSA